MSPEQRKAKEAIERLEHHLDQARKALELGERNGLIWDLEYAISVLRSPDTAPPAEKDAEIRRLKQELSDLEKSSRVTELKAAGNEIQELKTRLNDLEKERDALRSILIQYKNCKSCTETEYVECICEKSIDEALNPDKGGV